MLMLLNFFLIQYVGFCSARIPAIHPNRTIQPVQIHLTQNNNHTLRLFFNLSTNYSYYITFRSFGHLPMKFGPFPATFQYRQRTLDLLHYSETSESFHLFIICFYFLLRQSNDHETQCRDIRLIKPSSSSSSSGDFLPTYNPLFVPLMYALIVVMLLPMVIQHHREKQALLYQRRNEIRRLSISVVQETSEIIRPRFAKTSLSQIAEDEPNGTDIDLLDRTIFTDLPVTFTLDNLQPFIHRTDDSERDQESTVTADECIAHLLNTTPWRNSSSDHFPLMSSLETTHRRDFPTAMEDQLEQTVFSISERNSNEKHPKIKLHPVLCELDI